MMSGLLSMQRDDYRIALNAFLDEAPGGRFFNEDRFDLEAYKARGLALRDQHRAVKVSLFGKPSFNELSWHWTDQSLIMFLMSPINLTRLRSQAELYEQTETRVNICQYELAL